MRPVIVLFLLAGCGHADAKDPADMAAIHVAIADALIEARRPPDLPDDFGLAKSDTPALEAEPLPPSEEGYAPRLVIYTAPDWCEPCRRLDQQIERLKGLTINGVKGQWNGLIGTGDGNAIEIIDASRADSPEMGQAKAAGVTAWPTIIRIGKDGQESSRTTGVLTAEQLSQYQAGRWAPPKPKATASTGSPLGPSHGLHVHRCPTCSTEWAHGGGGAGEVVAHYCPKCGTMQWEIAYWGPLR